MGIIIIKVYKRFISILKVILWKSLYLNRFKKGSRSVFYPGTHMVLDANGSINIGNNCFFNHNCSLNSMGKIIIGNDCIFGENVKIYDHNHKFMDSSLFRKQGYDIKKVLIGSNCWIGSNVTILPGVKIGNNVVIGAGTIVTKDICDGSIVISDIKKRYL